MITPAAPELSDSNPSSREICLAGNWSELLSDLGCMGPMWTLTSTPGMELDYRADLTGIGVRDYMGLLSRQGHALRLMLNRCYLIRAITDDTVPNDIVQVSIEDRNRYSLLTLRPDSRGQSFLFRTVLRVHKGAAGEQRSAPESLFNLPKGTGGIQSMANLERRSCGICDGIDSSDVTELSGRTAFDPFELRNRGWTVAVDPDLIACALEYLVDQVVPLRIVTGNDGVVQRLDAALYSHRREGSWTRLGGEGVALRIDTRALYTAWVFQRAPRPTPLRELRLYNSDGRAMAIIGAQPTPEGAEPPVWRTVMNALVT